MPDLGFFGGFGSGLADAFSRAQQDRQRRQQFEQQKLQFQQSQAAQSNLGRALEYILKNKGTTSPFNQQPQPAQGGVVPGMQPQQPPGQQPQPMMPGQQPQPMMPGQPSQPMQQPGQRPPSMASAPAPRIGLDGRPVPPNPTNGDGQGWGGGMAQGAPLPQGGQGGAQTPNPQQAALIRSLVTPQGQKFSQMPGRGIGVPTPPGGGMPPRPQPPQQPQMPQGGGPGISSRLPGMGGPPIAGPGRNIGPSEPGSLPTFARGPGRGGPMNSPVDIIPQYESGNRNVMNYIGDAKHTAQGFFQITNTNWRAYAPRVGIDLNQYPTAMSTGDGPEGKELQKKVAQKMYDEQGFAPWAPYNPKLRAALARGDYGVHDDNIHLAAAKDPQGPAGKMVGQTPEGKAFMGQAGRQVLDWRVGLQAILAANPGIEPGDAARTLGEMMPYMNQDSANQFKEIQTQLREQGIQTQQGNLAERERHDKEQEDARRNSLTLSAQRASETVKQHQRLYDQASERLKTAKTFGEIKAAQRDRDYQRQLINDAERERHNAYNELESLGSATLSPELKSDAETRAKGGGRAAFKLRQPGAGAPASPGGPVSAPASAVAPKISTPIGRAEALKKSGASAPLAPPAGDKLGKKPVADAPPEIKDKLEAAQSAIADGTTTREEVLKWFQDRGYDVSKWI